MLTYPVFNKTFTVDIAASDLVGLSEVLPQIKDGKELVIGDFSKSLSEHYYSPVSLLEN